jgi:polysaccharide export outer membrane protein
MAQEKAVQESAVQGMSGLINSSDTVSVVVHREPDLNSNGQLAQDGTLSVPLIGSIQLAGRTTSVAEKQIEAKFRDGYLVRPQVTVRITKRLARTVTVNGQVSEPGVFTLPFGQQMTLQQVIGMAGGATDVANLKKVTLRRGSSGKSYTINLKDIFANKAKDIVLQKNDFIYIPEGLF